MIRKPRIQSKQSFYRNTSIGLIPKTMKACILESHLERDHMRLEVFNLKDGESFEMQPAPLPHLCNGKLVNYTPDSKKIVTNGKNINTEVKYEKDALTPENQEKFSFLGKEYEKKGEIFRVQTEKDIRVGHRADNLAYLFPSFIHPCPHEEFNTLVKNVSPKRKTIAQMHRIADKKDIPRLFVKRAIAHKLFDCDLTKPWTDLLLSWG